MLLYADENFPDEAVELLRDLGHDVLTVQQDERRGSPNVEILARAHSLGRVVLTHDRRDYQRLHLRGVAHSGIVSASQGDSPHSLAARIYAALLEQSAGRWCLRLNLPSC